MAITIAPGLTDDPAFVSMVERATARMDQDNNPTEVFVIEIKNWFDHKWLKFSGIGRVPFHNVKDDQPQVALGEFFQDKITFPPFTPSRVLREQSWAYETSKPKNPIHRKLRQHSSWNLQRRVTQFATSALFVWFSSGTKSNDRGSLMVYHVRGQEVSAWYASFRRINAWRLDRTKGVSIEAIESLTNTIRVTVPFPPEGST